MRSHPHTTRHLSLSFTGGRAQERQHGERHLERRLPRHRAAHRRAAVLRPAARVGAVQHRSGGCFKHVLGAGSLVTPAASCVQAPAAHLSVVLSDPPGSLAGPAPAAACRHLYRHARLPAQVLPEGAWAGAQCLMRVLLSGAVDVRCGPLGTAQLCLTCGPRHTRPRPAGPGVSAAGARAAAALLGHVQPAHAQELLVPHAGPQGAAGGRRPAGRRVGLGLAGIVWWLVLGCWGWQSKCGTCSSVPTS